VRVLGLDLGSKRIGVAVSDGAGRVATPVMVIARCGDRPRDHRRIAALAEEYGVERVVVGLPLSLDGTHGPAASAVEAESIDLAAVLDVPVEHHDERLSTVTAERELRGQGLDGRARRKVVDMVAAAIILQGWLDRRTTAAESAAQP